MGMKRIYVSLLTLTFFGLGPDYRAVLHNQLFYILDNVPGFSWTELYTMPIDLRRFYHERVVAKIKRYNEGVKEQNKKAQQSIPKIPRMPKLK